MILPILKEPDSRLRQVSKKVEKVDESIQQLMSDMVETMYHDDGAGLAAPQVGKLVRVLVADVSYKEGEPQEILKIANPEIIWVSEEKVILNEGCLSVPGAFAEVERPASMKLSYLDEFNTPQERLFENWAARVLLHEIDHLNGILFIDHLTRLKKERAIVKSRKQRT